MQRWNRKHSCRFRNSVLNYTFAFFAQKRRRFRILLLPLLYAVASRNWWSGASWFTSSGRRWASANKLSAVKDGSCFHWFHPSSNPCFDCSLKDIASILMISLALDPYLVAVRKSGLPSDLDLSAISCCLLLRALRGRSNTMTRTR